MGRGSQRNVALTGKQCRGGIEPDPAGTGDVDLGPGVQIGEVLGWAARTIHARLVGCSWTR